MHNKSYADYNAEEQLAVLRDYLPKLPEIVEKLEALETRKEHLEIEHKVDVDVSDIDGKVEVKNSLDVNDVPEMHESIKKLITTLENKDTNAKVTVKQEKTIIDLKKLEKLMAKLVEKEVVVNVEKETIKFPSTAKSAIPVRLSNGKQFYEAMFSGGGGIGKLANVSIVESTEFPGVYGMVMLNPDGSTISAGGGTTPTVTHEFLLENGDTFLLENGDKLLLESA